MRTPDDGDRAQWLRSEFHAHLGRLLHEREEAPPGKPRWRRRRGGKGQPDRSGGMRLSVSIASVVVDTDGDTVIVALVPSAVNASPLGDRSPTGWGTVTVTGGDGSPVVDQLQSLAQTGQGLTLTTTATGLRLEGGGNDLALALPTSPPGRRS